MRRVAIVGWLAAAVLVGLVGRAPAQPGYVGLGIMIKQADEDGRGPIVAAVVPKGPAGRDGRIQEGDELVGVEEDGEVVEFKGKSLEDVVEKIRGEEGSKVKLVVRPGGKGDTKTYELTRGPVITD